MSMKRHCLFILRICFNPFSKKVLHVRTEMLSCMLTNHSCNAVGTMLKGNRYESGIFNVIFQTYVKFGEAMTYGLGHWYIESIIRCHRIRLYRIGRT